MPSQPSVSSGGGVELHFDLACNGLPESADFYAGIALPDGVNLLQFTSTAFGTAFGSILDLAALDPVAAGVSLAGEFTVEAETQVGWSGFEPAGVYACYFVAVRAGALLDGAAGPGDVLFADLAPVVFTP
jgi:hypothetical protein